MHRVLIVDDEPGMRFLLRALLEELEPAPEVQEAASAAEARAQLAAGPWTVVVLDHRMPDGTGLEVARDAHRSSDPPPIVLYSGYLDEATRRAAAELGVPGIEKSRPEDLVAHVRGVLAAS